MIVNKSAEIDDEQHLEVESHQNKIKSENERDLEVRETKSKVEREN